MTIDKVITGNPISKNLLKPWGSNSNPNSVRGKLINTLVEEISSNDKLIFIRIQVKYTKFMIPLQVIMIDVQCYMT